MKKKSTNNIVELIEMLTNGKTDTAFAMKGIILVKDPMIVEIISNCFPEWHVLLSNCEKGVEFYPSPF